MKVLIGALGLLLMWLAVTGKLSAVTSAITSNGGGSTSKK